MGDFKEITTAEVQEAFDDPNVKIIDVRNVNAYNGWRLKGEKQGGHIPGARSLDVKWTKYIDWIEIVRSKGILPKHKIIIYGYNAESIEKVAQNFKKGGYLRVYIYTDFLKDWGRQDSVSLERLERYKKLVPAEWVQRIVEGKTPEGETERETVIVHAHYRNREAYLSGHIPGAIDMDTLALESPETWNRRSPEELKIALEKHGISADTRVVLYGKFLWPDNADEFPGSAAGHLGAIRCAMIMMYAGVKDVRVLNGGYQSWIDAHYPISTKDLPKKPISSFGVEIPQHSEYIVDMEEAKRMIEAKDADIVSVRSWPEFIGEVSGYNYIAAKGRIPGAIWGNCGSDAYHMENYRNLDHTIREADEVQKNWKEVEITADKKLAFYCGTGWRGSEAFYNAYLMGWPKVAVYDGGWYEWSSDPNNPIETGIPSKS